MKKAVIVVKLVPESSDVSHEQIAKEVIAKDEVPWVEKIGKVRFRRKV